MTTLEANYAPLNLLGTLKVWALQKGLRRQRRGMFFQLVINHPCWNFHKTGRWLSHYPRFLILSPLISSRGFQTNRGLKAHNHGINRMIMAKCLPQKANAKSLIFREPCNVRVDGRELRPSIPTSGAFTHPKEGSYVYAATGYTFSYMHTFFGRYFFH